MKTGRAPLICRGCGEVRFPHMGVMETFADLALFTLSIVCCFLYISFATDILTKPMFSPGCSGCD